MNTKTKCITHNGFNLSIEQIINHKGEGIIVSTTNGFCNKHPQCILDDTLFHPIVTRAGNKLIMLIDTSKPKKENYTVLVLSSIILKKTRVVDSLTVMSNQNIRNTTPIRNHISSNQRSYHSAW
jgi:hypothetical protein